MARVWPYALGLLVMVFASQAWSDSVRVRTSTGANYGRITFVWPAPVGHQSQKNGDQLVVNFSRPIEADLRPVLRGLSQYVAGAEAAPNNASVVFRIKGDFSVRSYDSGSSIVVDIIGTGGQTAQTPSEPAAPPQTQSTPSPATGLPNIGVRTGAHDDYSRVVFDWPTNTPFEVTRDGDQALIRFAAFARYCPRTDPGGRWLPHGRPYGRPHIGHQGVQQWHQGRGGCLPSGNPYGFGRANASISSTSASAAGCG